MLYFMMMYVKTFLHGIKKPSLTFYVGSMFDLYGFGLKYNRVHRVNIVDDMV